MYCPKCGTINPEDAQFCLECGTAFPKPTKMDFFQPSNSKYCPKCKVSNPIEGKFCFECGAPLEKKGQPQPSQCPTCGITIDPYRLFCPNCSQSLIVKPLETKMEQEQVPSIETRTECPACGQLTTGDYCRNCGYNLTIQLRKRPIDWWYCDRDSAIMTEIDPNLQILVSRTSLDASLAQAVGKNILQHQDREKARVIALQLFESGVTTKFEVLSQVRCPVCGQQSLAPTTQRPRHAGISYPREITLNVSTILQNGLFYFRTYPQLLLIILCAIITDGVLILIGLGSSSTFDMSSLFMNLILPITATPVVGTLPPLVTLVVVLLISFITNTFFQCWYYTSLKEIKHSKRNHFAISKSFQSSFRFLPRAVAAQFIILGLLVAIVIGVIFAIIIFSGVIFSDSGNYEIYFTILLMLLFLIIVVFALIALITILFSYVNMSIVFDDESGVILSLIRSWKFGRRYFWTTVGVIFILSIGSIALGYLQTIISFPIYFLFSSTLIISLVSTISTRLIEAYRSVSLGEAYDAFKHTID